MKLHLVWFDLPSSVQTHLLPTLEPEPVLQDSLMKLFGGNFWEVEEPKDLDKVGEIFGWDEHPILDILELVPDSDYYLAHLVTNNGGGPSVLIPRKWYPTFADWCGLTIEDFQ